MIQSIDYAAVAPPLILALLAGAVLLLDVFLPRTPATRTALGLVTLAGVLGALAAVAVQAARGDRLATFCVPAEPSGLPASCSYVADGLTQVFAAIVLATAVVIVLLSMTQLAGAAIPAGEWYFLLLCALTGAVTLPASRDLVMLVVALELVSLPVFALTALKRYDARASEAALKLFLVSVTSTAVMLFGVSLIYGLTASVHLDRIAARLAAPPAAVPAGVITVAVVLVLAGFAFKIAAVPFHFWAGDVYQGAPVPVAAFLSVISKAAGFAGLILVLTIALAGQAALWGPVVAVLAALTMTAGNLLALRQRHAVRLLAWSSVAQSGYILAALAVAAKTSAAASTAYLAIYAAMNAGAFAVVMTTGGRDELEDYRGLAFRRPAAAVALGFFLICLAGLPPGLSGLFAKIVVFREIVQGGLGWLAVVMAVNTVIGLYYYIAWTARLFTPAPGARPAGGVAVRPVTIAVAAALLVSVAFSVAPQLVLSAVG
ncbi:NADH-quinone oxidoreductase subunit N [Sphaerisporangium krabiense]|uniref:NADH-quinone oxidoreductase subunit N n=1 Tax=Sphaerisporangium krabiense TaxID=763782 RepID=A0A7W8Z0Q5_9ACTN|nr:NADH-quinone oxidoreductase subunit N [Sphaerisporangium krabiense]MBB5625349.1 NADH-quinone oxidoreductase subunit N [Sphaerisporangium krabiense]GII64136.1 NADH-quinone oxidoreductase subunit N [Sphaerisporangium krabiense]